MTTYSAHIQWSVDEREHVATSPDFPGLSALGSTAEYAVRELYVAVDVAVEAFRQDGEPVPVPRTLASRRGPATPPPTPH